MLAIINTAPYVFDISVVLFLAAVFGYIARKFRLPAIVGYLVVGLLVSPFTPGFVAEEAQIALLADFGVVLLLFEVGIELDLRRVSREQRSVLWASPALILFGTVAGGGIFLAMGIAPLGAFLLGLSIAMSSSVVIVNITRSRSRTTNPPTEEALLSWSLMQDIAGVASAAVILTIFGAGERPVAIAIGGLVLFTLIAYAVAQVLPRFLQLVRWESDLFLLLSVAVGLGVAALGTVAFGIPMALAAFVAGLSINQSRDTDEIRRVLRPFRDLFAVLFFVVIGSLVRPELLGEALPWALGFMVLMLAIKTAPAYLLTRFTLPKARPKQLAVGLSQMGEFSFVLATAAIAQGALTQVQFVALLIAVIATIVISTTTVRVMHPRPR